MHPLVVDLVPRRPRPLRGARLENKPSSQVAARSWLLHHPLFPFFRQSEGIASARHILGCVAHARATHSLTWGPCPTLQLPAPFTPSQAQQASAQRRIKDFKWIVDTAANATYGRSAPARAPPPRALASCLSEKLQLAVPSQALQDNAQLQRRIKERT
jgi:hypothetical protein